MTTIVPTKAYQISLRNKPDELWAVNLRGSDETSYASSNRRASFDSSKRGDSFGLGLVDGIRDARQARWGVPNARQGSFGTRWPLAVGQFSPLMIPYSLTARLINIPSFISTLNTKGRNEFCVYNSMEGSPLFHLRGDFFIIYFDSAYVTRFKELFRVSVNNKFKDVFD